MPQLDFLIVFPQIFWFFIIFCLFYVITLHFFIPKILVTLKFRKKLVTFNNLTNQSLELKLTNRKKITVQKIIISIKKIKNSIFLNQKKLTLILNKIQLDSKILNFKIFSSVLNLSIFCNKQILNSITLLPSKLNLK